MAARSGTRGARQAGSGQRRGCFDRTSILLGRRHPATGSHHSRRAPYDHPDFTSNAFSEDLFSASLGLDRTFICSGSRIIGRSLGFGRFHLFLARR